MYDNIQFMRYDYQLVMALEIAQLFVACHSDQYFFAQSALVLRRHTCSQNFGRFTMYFK